MIASVSRKITEIFINNNIIKSEDKEVYSYGLEYIISSALPIILALTVSLIFRITGIVIAYMLTFILFRVCAGGFHASSHLKCQILFYTVLAISVSSVKLIVLFNDASARHITVLVSAAASAIIFLLAPVDCPNKPFSRDEYIKFRNRTRILDISVLFGLTAGIHTPIDPGIFLSMSIAMLTIAVSLIIAKKGGKKDEESTVSE